MPPLLRAYPFPTHATRMAIARYKHYHRGLESGPAFAMQDYAKTFYKSKAWQSCRASYLKQARGLCEVCLRRGQYVPADTVHHIKHITPQNITDPTITLSFSNLMAVCRNCHAELHKSKKRYRVDKFGRVTA